MCVLLLALVGLISVYPFQIGGFNWSLGLIGKLLFVKVGRNFVETSRATSGGGWYSLSQPQKCIHIPIYLPYAVCLPVGGVCLGELEYNDLVDAESGDARSLDHFDKFSTLPLALSIGAATKCQTCSSHLNLPHRPISLCSVNCQTSVLFSHEILLSKR
ncbi:hypothetical protein D917_08554 [Trichinella nativa]|uniref:Uncharacterized protein n=1 Tax=Trichinella nativa TaxID=6335 RepID=A0A1Y3EJB1_9BILA|nr:hypothetical protein D917_08554 [Trichinella nativa]